MVRAREEAGITKRRRTASAWVPWLSEGGHGVKGFFEGRDAARAMIGCKVEEVRKFWRHGAKSAPIGASNPMLGTMLEPHAPMVTTR